MKLPTVSIITPSYNQGEFIQETIESVLQQKDKGVEYWVIDGGSTDNTVAILKRYGKRLNWISEKDKGQTDAINKGLQRVTGDIVGYINSDDVLAPGAIAHVRKVFMEHDDAVWVTGEYDVISGESQKVWSLAKVYKTLQRRVLQYAPLLLPLLLSINNPIAQPSTFWLRSAHKKLGMLDEKLRYTMDYDWWWKLLSLSRPQITSRTLSQFRVHAASKGGSDFTKQLTEQLQVAKRHGVGALGLWLQNVHNNGIRWMYRKSIR